jgi:hypothetical protein
MIDSWPSSGILATVVAGDSQTEHGQGVASFEVIVRYVAALSRRLDLVADFSAPTVRLPVSGAAAGTAG